MISDIKTYNEKQAQTDKEICDLLASTIDSVLKEAESKIWHAHPVWFLEGNPVAGYSKIKSGVRMFFWSGKSFDERGLEPSKGKFQDAFILYTNVNQINEADMIKWIQKSKEIQWDYKNIVKRKGELIRLK